LGKKARLRAVSAEGISLNAEFTLDIRPDGFDLILESRSGAAEGDETPRNRDYERFMGLLFRRAAALGATLTGAWVASARTSNLNEADRLLKAEAFPYPIDLAAVADLETLRTRLSAAQGAIGRRPGARGPGNRNKRVLLAFHLASPLDTRGLEEAIVTGDLPWVDEVYVEPVASPPRALDLGRLQALLDRYEHAAPRVRRGLQRRVERGPVGDVVKSLNNHRCQICAALDLPSESFRKRDGLPYVEAHHVEGVASGSEGVLRAANVITVCANHHRELHHGGSVAIVDLGDQFEIRVEAGTTVVDKVLLGRAHVT